MDRVRWALLLLLFAFSTGAWSNRSPYLYRSSKALMMGDAYTTLATGGSTLFYNPALSMRGAPFSLYPLPVDMSLFHILDEKDRFDSADTNEVSDFANAIIGLPIHFKGAFVPSLKFANFTFTSFMMANGDITIRDRIHPVTDFYYQSDRGFSLGFAWMVFGSKKRGPSLSAGASVKHIRRDAIIKQYDLFGKTFSDLISSSSTSLDGFKRTLGQTRGKGWGMDLGVDWRHRRRNSTWALGFSAMDVFDTKIKTYEGTGPMPAQPMSLNFGTSFSQDLVGLMDWTVSFDLHPLGEKIKLKEKAHFGVRLGVPFIDLYVGNNGGGKSYGASFSIFPIELALGVYEKKRGEEKKKRLIAYFSLLDIDF